MSVDYLNKYSYDIIKNSIKEVIKLKNDKIKMPNLETINLDDVMEEFRDK